MVLPAVPVAKASTVTRLGRDSHGYLRIAGWAGVRGGRIDGVALDVDGVAGLAVTWSGG